MKKSNTQLLISEECDKIKSMLLEKNRKYGDSAINPIRLFSKASTTEQIRVRLDDKINRLKNAQDDEDEDVLLDLVGYIVLLRIAERVQNGEDVKEQNEEVAQRCEEDESGTWRETYRPSLQTRDPAWYSSSLKDELNEGYNYGGHEAGYRD